VKGYNANAVSSFWDKTTTSYWDARIPYNSVKTAGSGVRIDITGVSSDRQTYSVRLWKP
jgi:hypothetical protein